MRKTRRRSWRRYGWFQCAQVLDLCCAPGAKLCMISDLLSCSGVSSGSVTGVDVSLERIQAAKALAVKYACPRVRLFLADGTCFGVPPPVRAALGSLLHDRAHASYLSGMAACALGPTFRCKRVRSFRGGLALCQNGGEPCPQVYAASKRDRKRKYRAVRGPPRSFAAVQLLHSLEMCGCIGGFVAGPILWFVAMGVTYTGAGRRRTAPDVYHSRPRRQRQVPVTSAAAGSGGCKRGGGAGGGSTTV